MLPHEAQESKCCFGDRLRHCDLDTVPFFLSAPLRTDTLLYIAPYSANFTVHALPIPRAAEAAPSGARTKRKGHPWFPFLFELLPFLQMAWAQIVDFVSAEKRERQRIFSTARYNTFPYRRLPYCYTGGEINAGAAYPCRANWLLVLSGLPWGPMTYRFFPNLSQSLNLITVGRGAHTPPFQNECFSLNAAGWGQPALR